MQRRLLSFPNYDKLSPGDERMMRKKLQGSILLLLTTIIWGFGFIAQSVGMDTIGPFTFQAIRCALAVIFLFLCTFVMERNPRESFAKWKNPELWKVGLICGVALFVASSLQQLGLVYTDAGGKPVDAPNLNGEGNGTAHQEQVAFVDTGDTGTAEKIQSDDSQDYAEKNGLWQLFPLEGT